MTTPPSSLPPANWYPDPQTPGQLRYWDGQKWTQHVHPAAQPAQGVGGAGGPLAAGPSTGTFMPSGRPGATQSAGGAQPGSMGEQGSWQAGAAGGPGQANGTQGVFQPGLRAAGGPFNAASTLSDIDDDKLPRGQDPHDPVHWLVPTGRSIQAFLAGLFGFLALLATAASVYGLGTDYDIYVTYAAGGLAFLAILFGFAGLSKANQGEHGRGRSYFGLGVGFLCLGLNAYEAFYPGELLDIFKDYLPS